MKRLLVYLRRIAAILATIEEPELQDYYRNN